jgi:hypothetical protein
MRSSIKIYLLTGLLAGISNVLSAQEDARQIYTKAMDLLLTENMEMVLEMDITDNNGRVKMKGYEVLVARFGDMEKTKMSWQKPEAARGTTVIFTELPDETGLIEVFTPSNGKIRKLKATPDNINMVGSEMRMTNITARDTDELSFRLLGKEEVGGISCHHIEVKAIDAQDHARGELMVEETSYHIVQINVFDKGGKLTSTVKLSDFQPVGGAARKVQPMQIHTEDIEEKKLTEIRVLKIASRTDLKEEDFQLPAEKDL